MTQGHLYDTPLYDTQRQEEEKRPAKLLLQHIGVP